MSEHQYYEFLAVDRPLSEADRQHLRAMSSRGQITSTRFTNTYDFGDFKGDPVALMKRCFDLHLHLANWGSRRLMIKLPKRLIDRSLIAPFVAADGPVSLTETEEQAILEIDRAEIDDENSDDDSDWLASLEPLRAAALMGDTRLFYLLWLMGVEEDRFAADVAEPLPGLGPLTGAINAFAEFFAMDFDLIDAAAERDGIVASPATAAAAAPFIAALGEAERNALLTRVFAGDAGAAVDLRAAVRERMPRASGPPREAPRTVGELRARALALGEAREKAEAEKQAAENRKLAAEAQAKRRARLIFIRARGEAVWRDVETEIERRNPRGYDKAAELVLELQMVAGEDGADEAFQGRLRTLRERHASKRQFIKRLAELA